MTNKLTLGGEAMLDSALGNPCGVSAPAAREAHRHLLAEAARMNLRAEPHTSAITAVKLYDRQDRYLFSWIINAHHLLFYIRKPALKAFPALAERAQSRLPGAKINAAGEVTIRLETAVDAEVLTRWLYDPATWSSEAAVRPSLAPTAKSLPRQAASKLSPR